MLLHLGKRVGQAEGQSERTALAVSMEDTVLV